MTTLPPIETRLRMYETMVRIRACDDRIGALVKRGRVFFVYYSPRGQEGVPAAVAAAMRPGDFTVTTYRGLHDQVAAGAALVPLISEMFGRATGTCGGKGGPMHIVDPEAGVMMTTGIVGSGLPIANGLALSSQLRGENKVTVVNFGDGATNIGAFHEALNLAAVWDLPVVFVCQNNQYGEFTPRLDSQRCANVADRAAGYGIPGVTVDGNDPDQTWAAASEAIDRARAGRGPTLLECNTYRFNGHFLGEDMAYMPQDEREAAMAADPVPGYRARLVADADVETEILEIEARVLAEVDEAIESSLAAPRPSVDALGTDVLAGVVVS